MIKVTAIIAVLSCFMIQEVEAQKIRRHKGRAKISHGGEWSYTFGAGLSGYAGDLCGAGFQCLSVRPSFGIGAHYNIAPHFAAFAELNYVRIASQDTWADETRTVYFKSNDIELFVAGTYKFGAINKNYNHKNEYVPFVFAGVGATYFNPQGEIDGEFYNLRDVETNNKSYSQITPIIPLGIGFKWNINSLWAIIAEYGYRITFTDYLDNVSDDRINFNELSPLAQEYHLENNSHIDQDGTILKHGNPNANDGYGIFMIKVKYHPVPSKSKSRRRIR